MQNYNSYFLVRLTINRTCLLALFILVLAISPLMAIDEARAVEITFDEQSGGTVITNQYQNSGVIFSGEPQPPIIYSGHPMFGIPPTDKILGSSSQSSSIIASFVDPTDGIPVEASNVWLDLYFYINTPPTFL
jgi:hypothetical protein